MDIVFKGSGVNEVGTLNGREVVRVDNRYFRPTEVDILVGDASKARKVLGWEPKYNLKDLVKEKKISVLIGPEGDFSPAERELILSKPETVSFTLSKNILRADTAAISAISIVNFIHNNH